MPIVIFFSILPQICIIRSIENNILTYLSFISFTQYFVDFSNILIFYIIFSPILIWWFFIKVIFINYNKCIFKEEIKENNLLKKYKRSYINLIFKILLIILAIFIYSLPIYCAFIESNTWLLFFIFFFLYSIFIFIFYFKNEFLKKLTIWFFVVSYILINFYVYSWNNFWYTCYDIEEKKCEKIYYKNDKYVFIKDKNNKVKVVNISEMKVWKVDIKN